jgi:hypothetical protein
MVAGICVFGGYGSEDVLNGNGAHGAWQLDAEGLNLVKGFDQFAAA